MESRWGRVQWHVLYEDVLAYHQQLEDLSHESQSEASFLVKREELDTQMVEHTRLVLDVRVLYLSVWGLLNLTLLCKAF